MRNLILYLRYNKNITQNDIASLSRKLSLEFILNTVCKVIFINKYLLEGTSKQPRIVMARHIYFYFARGRTDFTLEKIGAEINKNHDTVINGIRKVERNIKYDEELKEYINQINVML